MVQKEQQQNSERKRQLDVIDVIASKTAKKENGKKARIQKIGRQTAVDQQAQQQAQLQAARFLPNSPHSMSPHGKCLCLIENAKIMFMCYVKVICYVIFTST